MSKKPDPKLPVGTVFGKWMMLEKPRIESDKVLCRCECGATKKVRYSGLIRKESRACIQCGHKGQNATHGCFLSGNPDIIRLYNIWNKINYRCTNKKHIAYHRYGGRGISVCEEWANDFAKFSEWALANGYDKNLTLDRHPDNNGNYEPSNCRWATAKQQMRNRRSNREATAFGETKLLCEWAEDPRCLVRYQCFRERIKRGMKPEDALTKKCEYFGANQNRNKSNLEANNG